MIFIQNESRWTREFSVRFLHFILYAFPLFFFGAVSNELQQGLRALQQIRSLIPERFVEEEFDIIVDKAGFEKPLCDLCSHKNRDMNIASTCITGDSGHYLLRWTVSGESVRILDSYEEFQFGPFWKYPTAMEHLEEMESAVYRMDK